MNRPNLAFVMALAASALGAWADPLFTFADSAGRKETVDLYPSAAFSRGILPSSGSFTYYSEDLRMDTLAVDAYRELGRPDKIKALYGRLLRVSVQKVGDRTGFLPDSIRALAVGDTGLQIDLMQAQASRMRKDGWRNLAAAGGVGAALFIYLFGPIFVADQCDDWLCSNEAAKVVPFALGTLALGAGAALVLSLPSPEEKAAEAELQRRLGPEATLEYQQKLKRGKHAPLGFSVSMRF